MSPTSIRERAPALTTVAILAIVGTLAACSRGEPEAGQPRAAAPAVEMPKPAEPAPAVAETSDRWRERLARQEAASKMFDTAEPPKAQPPKTQPPPPPVAKVPEAPKREPAKVPPAKADPPKADSPKADPPKADPPKSDPPKEEAKRAPPPKPAAPPDIARLVTKVDPEFPREAVKAGAGSGTVKARLTLDAVGNVTEVEVVEAIPRRIFDRAVVRALSQWKYSEGAAGRRIDVEVAFTR
jgi:protein TonB